MEPRKVVNHKRGPEAIIQDAIIAFLRNRLWYVKSTHGNMYQAGFPDLYCCHPIYGARWVEVKNPVKYEFTAAQQIEFPLMSGHGAHIWILTAATETEYKKLFGPPNWTSYLLAKM